MQSTSDASTRVVIAAVPFSDNVGDQAIYEGLASDLGRRYRVHVTPLDIAGRTEAPTSPTARVRRLRAQAALPRAVRPAATLAMIGPPTLRRARGPWFDMLSSAEVLVIGGGQLLADTALNFPTKLNLLARAAERAGVRSSALFGVGVSPSWSHAGRRLVADALHRLQPVGVWVRDADSEETLEREFGLQSEVVPDPAVLAARFDPPAARHAVLWLASSEADVRRIEGTQGGEVLTEAEGIRRLSEAGHHVAVATTGAFEDEAAKLRLELAFQSVANVRFLQRPTTPLELRSLLAAADIVFGRRLHGHVLAQTLGIPSVVVPPVSAKVAGYRISHGTAGGRPTPPHPVADLLGLHLFCSPGAETTSDLQAHVRLAVGDLADALALPSQ